MYKFKIKDESFARGFIECPSEDLYMRTASATYKLCSECALGLHNGIPLYVDWDGQSIKHSFCGFDVDIDKLKAKAAKDPENANDYETIISTFRPFVDLDRKINDSFTQEERDIVDVIAGWGGTWRGHAVPDFADIAKYGTNGMREKILYYKNLNKGKDDFYDALILTMDAVDVLASRYHDYAAELLTHTSDEKEIKRLNRIVRAFKNSTKEPAEDFVAACLIYSLLVFLDSPDSPGHFDWYMWEFWQKTEYSEARAVLEDIWEWFHLLRIWNLCISGSDENWNDHTNDLSYEILDVARKYKYQTPNLTMRVHRNTPEKLLQAAAETVATGIGMPVFYNDEAVCPALERLGIPPKDSHLYVMNGCNQIDIQGKSHMGLEDGEVNLGKAVEAVFSRGYDRISGRKFALDTGDPTSFKTFDEFYDAVIKQIDYLIENVCDMANRAHIVYSVLLPDPLRAATIEGCLEKGRGYKNCGPLYGHGQVLAEGVSDIIDSVFAVKKFVYEEKRFSMDELNRALEADFEGYEDIFSVLHKSEWRFGNDIPEVDEIAKAIIDHYNSKLLTIPTARGGYYGGGCSPFERAAYNGAAVAALPNGKRKAEPLYADSIGATPGRDVEGPTALLNSCMCFDHTLPTSGFILNIKFDKDNFNTETGKNAFIALLKTYFNGKGQQLSAAVLSREELLDAKVHPENHRNLIVRVGGYSDYFINLSNELQDNVITRTMY